MMSMAMILVAFARYSPLNYIEPNTSHTYDGNTASGPDFRLIYDSPDAGYDAAAKQPGDIKRNIRRDRQNALFGSTTLYSL